MAREINLVPDIKNEMIRTLKLRNFIFFVSGIVSITCLVVLIIFGTIVGGQNLAKSGKEGTLSLMSEKITKNSDTLKDYLTIRSQLTSLDDISDKKRVLSRTFNILSALIPTGADTITISELNVNLANANPTFSFDAQANAGREPFIDYNVLDSFKKSMEYMYYDYGDYVDRNGTKIPAYCMIENGEDGTTLSENGSIYALWTIGVTGCNPNGAKYAEAEATTNPAGSNTGSDEDQTSGQGQGSSQGSSSSTKKPSSSGNDYDTELYDGQSVVRIWRTPQFDQWYEDGNMKLDGQISGVPHFKSKCITYSGQLDEKSGDMKWSNSKSCRLVPSKDGEPGIKISNSSNGRGAGDELVLRFSAVITLDPGVYAFDNPHVLAIPPADRVNVTDSYVQIQSMFGEPARACDPGDTACTNSTSNVNGGNN